MELIDANKLAIKLMKQHKLYDCYFEFDNAVKRFGAYSHTYNKIKLSRQLTLANSEKVVRNIILHEIAHALAGADAHHNRKWQQIAKSIGCDGKRCYSTDEVTAIPYKYVGVCNTCNRRTYRHRRTKFVACGVCCDKYNKGQWSKDYEVKWERIEK